MSLHTLVGNTDAGRRFVQRLTPARAVAVSPTVPDTTLLGRTSMRVLEAGLALTAIATALLLGIGR